MRLACAAAVLAIAIPTLHACVDDSPVDQGSSPISWQVTTNHAIPLQGQTCGAANQPCCVLGPNQISCDPGLACGPGNVCLVPPPPQCGTAGQVCCNGTTCDSGLTCDPPVCQGQFCGAPTCVDHQPPPPPTCGAQGQACCNGAWCNQGLACANQVCS